MEAKALPARMDTLKKEINKLLFEFNREVGLEISEVHVQPMTMKELDGSAKLMAYDVAIGMDF